MKRALCLILTIFMVLAIVPFASSADEGGTISYTVKDGNVIITKCARTVDGTMTIPATIGGKPVTEIGECAFLGCEKVKGVTLPDSLKKIGDDAFSNCTSLTSIVIPNGVTYIGDCAFYGATALKDITVPDSVTHIGGFAFNDTKWLSNQSNGIVYAGKVAYTCKGTVPENITVKNGTKAIACEAFSSFDIKSVSLPDSLTYIGKYAFWYDTALTEITIPAGVTEICEYAFAGCIGLTKITVNAGNKNYKSQGNCLIEIESKKLVQGCKNSVIPQDGSVKTIGVESFEYIPITSITIPSCIRTIEKYAFYGCDLLESVTISEGVKTICEGAFCACDLLASISFPASVKSIDIYVLSDCTALTEIKVDAKNRNYISKGNCLIDTAKGVLLAGCNNSVIPSDCGITSIANGAFESCAELKSVTIPEGVTSIASYAFNGCSALESVTLPETLTSIGVCAFEYDASLASLNIPDSVTYVGDEAFYGTKWFDNQPDGVIYTGKVLYKYKGTMPANTEIDVQEGTTEIAPYAFNDCDGLTNITVPDSLYNIGAYAFYGTTWYNNQKDGVIYLGNVLLDYRGEMPENTSIDVKYGTTGIADNAFAECKLVSITIPETVIKIGRNCFYDTELKSVKLPEGVEYIGDYAFESCPWLVSVEVPESIKKIGYDAFNDCSMLSLKGACGSYAEHYAKENDIEFVITGYSSTFIDVHAGAWYTVPCIWCNAHGYITGTGDRVFNPDGQLTRAMFVQILAKVANINLKSITYSGKFMDVKSNDWFAKAVQWAVEDGITSGAGDGMFAPNAVVTREQLATFFLAYAKSEEYDTSKKADISKYPDSAKVSSWAVNAVKWAVAEGLISGVKTDTATILSPDGIATRAQAAVIFKSFAENYVANQK